ncbi:MAG: VOC family protein [Chthonomonadaceae bacterium]|nr:VOC family protein [Chthonomonadaceae bacterium]
MIKQGPVPRGRLAGRYDRWTVPRLDAIGIISKNLESTIAFYRLLGLDIPNPAPCEDHVESVNAPIRVMFDDVEMVKGFVKDWVEPVGTKMALAFLCGSAAEVDDTHLAIVAAGYQSKTEPWDAFWGQRYAQVIDPDGNVVDLFAPL